MSRKSTDNDEILETKSLLKIAEMFRKIPEKNPDFVKLHEIT